MELFIERANNDHAMNDKFFLKHILLYNNFKSQ